MFTGDFSYQDNITGFVRGAPTTPSCDARALSALRSLLAFRPLQIGWPGWPARYRGSDSLWLGSLVADGGNGVAPAGLYS